MSTRGLDKTGHLLAVVFLLPLRVSHKLIAPEYRHGTLKFPFLQHDYLIDLSITKWLITSVERRPDKSILYILYKENRMAKGN
jgi:hypothetical protein